MLAVLKKNMSFSQHNNTPLWRSHADIQAALKSKHQSISLSAVTDLASYVSSMLLALPLPSKSDQGELDPSLAVSAFILACCKAVPVACVVWLPFVAAHRQLPLQSISAAYHEWLSIVAVCRQSV